MREDDCTDGVRSEEIVVYRGLGILGTATVVLWHPELGIVNVVTEQPDGTHIGPLETHIPDIAKKKFCKSNFRLFLDKLLDSLFT